MKFFFVIYNFQQFDPLLLLIIEFFFYSNFIILSNYMQMCFSMIKILFFL